MKHRIKKIFRSTLIAFALSAAATLPNLRAMADDTADNMATSQNQPLSSRPQDPLLYMSNNPSNRMCKDAYFLLHIPLNYNLLRDNIRGNNPAKEIFQLPYNYPRFTIRGFGATDEFNIKENAPDLYTKLNEKDHQIYGYDYYALGRVDDIDFDGKKDLVYFISQRGYPDFGKLYLGQSSPEPLRKAIDNLDAVGLIGYYNRTYVVTREKNELGIYSISTKGAPSHSQMAPDAVDVEKECYFTYRPPQQN